MVAISRVTACVGRRKQPHFGLEPILQAEAKFRKPIPEIGDVALFQADAEAPAGSALVTEREIFFDGHGRRRAAHRVLKEPPDTSGALVFGKKGVILARPDKSAGIAEERTRNRVEEGGLPRAVSTDDGDEIAVLQG